MPLKLPAQVVVLRAHWLVPVLAAPVSDAAERSTKAAGGLCAVGKGLWGNDLQAVRISLTPGNKGFWSVVAAKQRGGWILTPKNAPLRRPGVLR